MKFLKLLIVLFILTFFSVFAMSSKSKLTPQQIVANFIVDYEKWNEKATQNLSENTEFQTKEEYIKLLNKYCAQSIDRIGYDIYGQYSLHIADGERILSIRKNEQGVIIKTGVPSRFGETDFDMDYFEYYLIYYKGKYLIEEVYKLSRYGKKTRTL